MSRLGGAGPDFVFELLPKLKNDRVYVFAAGSQGDRDRWVHAINRRIAAIETIKGGASRELDPPSVKLYPAVLDITCLGLPLRAFDSNGKLLVLVRNRAPRRACRSGSQRALGVR